MAAIPFGLGVAGARGEIGGCAGEVCTLLFTVAAAAARREVAMATAAGRVAFVCEKLEPVAVAAGAWGVVQDLPSAKQCRWRLTRAIGATGILVEGTGALVLQLL